jgi:alanine racemase
MLYGLYPSDEVSKDHVKLKEVMSLHAKISRVEKFDKGVGVSYGHRFITSKETTIATLPLGYGDGFARNLSFKASAWVKKYNKKAPIIGTICMDQCMIDVTGMDLQMGDEVYLFGPNLPIDEVASQLETINYEIVCMMNKRIPRVYKKSGKIVQIVDNVLAL